MRRPSRTAVVAAVAATTVLAGCASTRSGAGSVRPFVSPLATAVNTADGAWATVAVGGPNGTFWQLLYRAAGSGSWTDDVAATATATNAGIVMAASGTQLLAGVRASQNLTFSPVVETTSAGGSWTDGVLPGALAATPQALAASADGPKAAILGQQVADQEVVSTAADITRWTRVATARALAHSAPSCRLRSIDAAAYVSSTLLIGGACSASGVAGLFALVPGRAPAALGPELPPDTTSQALAVSATGHDVSALLMLRRHGQASIVSATAATAATAATTATAAPPALTLGRWQLSAPLPLDPPSGLVSVTAGAGGFVVLVGRSGHDDLYGVGPGSARWSVFPAPPDGVSTIAVLPGGRLSALAGDGTTVVSWDLPPSRSTWARVQSLDVPVLYGSTS